MIGAYILVY